MKTKKAYQLPDLPYGLDEMEPVISRKQLEIHYTKHHQAYIDKANELTRKIQETNNQREAGLNDIANKVTFNVGGDVLHSLFWQNLQKPSDKNMVNGKVAELIDENFGSFDQFQKDFFDISTTIEGSGWGAVVYDRGTGRLLIEQIGNHNLRLIPNTEIILVLDMWEHAYYLDYQNDKKAYANNFWKIVNWQEVNKRLEGLIV